MFEKLEDLAKNNKKISDFHIRAGSPLAYRATGEIIKVNEVMVTPQDLKDLLSMNCNEEELEKFEKLDRDKFEDIYGKTDYSATDLTPLTGKYGNGRGFGSPTEREVASDAEIDAILGL